MNALSLNIRGMADSHKFDWLRRLLHDCKFSYCGLQETRLSHIPPNIGDWWGIQNLGIDYVESIGNSGGIISFWDRGIFQEITTIKSRHFLAIVGYWAGITGETIMLNVYAPQSPTEKKILWQNISNLIHSRPGNWIIFGDFNAVRRPEERLNLLFCPRIATAFNNFIANSGLLDLNMGGRKFTYFCEAGFKFSKLDRFLVCSNFMAAFPTASVTAFPREYSDHSPILLRTSYLDFGPTPFRFFKSWLFRTEFDNVVLDAWDNFIGDGTADSYLANKLRSVKEAIKLWTMTEFDKENKILKGGTAN
ncbi:hypothetical protein LXL04_007889 [Taraxacum kok-saghyz]